MFPGISSHSITTDSLTPTQNKIIHLFLEAIVKIQEIVAILGSEFGKLNPCYLGASFRTRCEVRNTHNTRGRDSLYSYSLRSTDHWSFQPYRSCEEEKVKCLNRYEKNIRATPVSGTTDVLPESPWIQKHQGPFIFRRYHCTEPTDLQSACHVPGNMLGTSVCVISFHPAHTSIIQVAQTGNKSEEAKLISQ